MHVYVKSYYVSLNTAHNGNRKNYQSRSWSFFTGRKVVVCAKSLNRRLDI